MSLSSSQSEKKKDHIKNVVADKDYGKKNDTNKLNTSTKEEIYVENVIPMSNSSSDEESRTSSDEKTDNSKVTNILELKTNLNEKTEDITDESDIEDDLVSAINYNTINSLAALKDMLQSSGEDSEGVNSFFHHYFLSHVNRLPSRNQTHSPYPWGRRLSECREEDEYETEEG